MSDLVSHPRATRLACDRQRGHVARAVTVRRPLYRKRCEEHEWPRGVAAVPKEKHARLVVGADDVLHARVLVVDKEEPRSKRGHRGTATRVRAASAGGVRTATLASRPLREGRTPAVRV